MALFSRPVQDKPEAIFPKSRRNKKEPWQDPDFQNQVKVWTRQRYETCKTARQQFERQWYLNIAFYLGRQNVSLFPLRNASGASGTRLYTPPVPYYRSRPVINLIRPAIRSELARLTSQKPTAVIVPSSNDDRDMLAAQAGEQLWDSIYRDKKIKSVFRQTMMWTLTTGNGFLKTYWDGNKRDKAGNQGDFCFDVITPFHLFFPDMLCDDIEDQPYIIHATTKTLEWVKINFPDLKVEPNVMEASDLLNDSFLNLVGANNIRNNAVLCYEVWVKPKQLELMPNGGMFLVVGDHLVQYADGFQYLHQQYPFAHIRHIPANRFYGDSVIVDLMPIQREYNRTRGQIMENKNRMGHTKIVAQKGSIDVSKITSEPGQAILYNLGYQPPVVVPPVNLPSYVTQEIDRLRIDFEDISGQHDISKGQTPPGVTAATAISFLQEQDETMLSATFQSIEEGYEKIGYQTLCLVKQFWTVPRTVKVVGEDGQFNALTFMGSDIGNNTDIRVEAGSALPTSKAAKQALVMDLMSQGFIPPEKGLEMLDMANIQRLYDEIKIDNSQASRENLKMSAVTQQQLSDYYMTFIKPPVTETPTEPLEQILMGADPMAAEDPMAPPESPFIDPQKGGPLQDGSGMPTEPPLIVPVNSYDNHMVHITVHNNYRKSQQFENLPQEVKDLFEQHVNQHMMAMGVMPGQPTSDGSMMDSGSMQNMGVPPGSGEEEMTEEGGALPNGQ